MFHKWCVFLAAATLAGVTATAVAAGDSSIGVTITSDREAGDFAVPKDMKYEIEAAHTFANGVTISGSVTYNNDAFSDVDNENVEGTVGYRARFNNVFAVTGSAGVGEHFQAADEGGDFPYYVFRIATELTLSRKVKWTAVSYRFRDAFDAGNDYNTPQLATAIAYRLSEHSSVSAKLAWNWSNGDYSSTGISLGYAFGF